MKKIKILTLYKINKITNDLEVVKEYYDIKNKKEIENIITEPKTIEDLKQDYNIKGYTYNDYIATYDETTNTYKSRYILKDKYIILKSYEELEN